MTFTANNGCTYCGSDSHMRSVCPWAEKERQAFEKWAASTPQGSQLRYVRDALPDSDPRYGEYVSEALRIGLEAWHARAQAQAAPDEAVAYQFEERVWVQGGGGSIWREQLEVHEPDQDQREVRNLIALYAHSAPSQPQASAAQSAPVVPEGWRLVPVEPTDAMLAAYEFHAIAPMGPISVYGYRAMLAAASKVAPHG